MPAESICDLQEININPGIMVSVQRVRTKDKIEANTGTIVTIPMSIARANLNRKISEEIFISII